MILSGILSSRAPGKAVCALKIGIPAVCHLLIFCFLGFPAFGVFAYQSNIVVQSEDKADPPKRSRVKIRFPQRSCIVGRPCEVAVFFPYADDFSGCSCVLQWGDGEKTDVLPVSESVPSRPRRAVFRSHTYHKGGSYSVFFSCGAMDGSASVKGSVQVRAVGAKLLVLRDIRKHKQNGQLFHFLIKKGSFPISSWSIDFGDGTVKNGKGNIDVNSAHFYWKRGTYHLTLTAVDREGGIFQRKMRVVVRADADMADAGAFFAAIGASGRRIPSVVPGTQIHKGTVSASSENMSGPAPESSLGDGRQISSTVSGLNRAFTEKESPFFISSVSIPDVAHANTRMQIVVAVANTTDVPEEGCFIVLDTGDIFTTEKSFSLRPRSSSIVQFSWFPASEGTQSINVHLRCEAETGIFTHTVSRTVEVSP